MIHIMKPSDDMFAALNKPDVTVGLVVPVNCVGVMGKGLAKVFAERFPEIVPGYQKSCDLRWTRPGRIQTLPIQAVENLWSMAILFPTKDHWRNPSKIEYIERGLKRMAQMAMFMPSEVHIPALGCGLGGLIWSDVEPLLHHYLGDAPFESYCYPPQS